MKTFITGLLFIGLSQIANAGSLDKNATIEQKLLLALKVCTHHDGGQEVSTQCSDLSSTAILVGGESGMNLVRSMCRWATDPFSYTVCLENIVDFSGQRVDVEGCPVSAGWNFQTEKQIKRKNCLLNQLSKSVR